MKRIKKTLGIIIVIILISLTGKSQDSTFTRVFFSADDNFSVLSFAKTHDLGFICIGSNFIIKTDGLGNKIWDKNVAGTNLRKIVSTHDSSYIIAAESSSGSFTVLNVIKINDGGDLIWAKKLDLGYNEHPGSIIETSDKGIVIAGNAETDNKFKISVVKLDSAGNMLWTRKLVRDSTWNMVFSIKEAPDGGLIMAGLTTNFSPMQYVPALIKLSADGILEWARVLENVNALSTKAVSVEVTSTGYLVLVNQERAMVVKTDFNGNVLDCRDFDVYFTWSVYTDSYPSINLTPEGGYFFVTTGQVGSLVKSDSSGNTVMISNIMMETVDAVQSYDNGFMVIGNGPMMGVEMAPTLRPHFGLMRIDSAGYSYSCIETYSGTGYTCLTGSLQVAFNSSVFTTSISDIQPAINPGSVETYTGCVEVTGGTTEKLSNSINLKIYPNPAKGYFSIDIKGYEHLDFKEMQIFNIHGKSILITGDPQVISGEIDMTSQPEGMYFIRLRSSEGNYYGRVMLRK